MNLWHKWKLRILQSIALRVGAVEKQPEMAVLPLAKDLLGDRPGSAPMVPEWNLVVAAILAANNRSLTSVIVRIEGGDIAMSIGFALEEFGYKTMAYYVNGNREVRDLEVVWRNKEHIHAKHLAKA